MTKTITPKQASSMNPWELAHQLSPASCEIQFTGDMNPFDHGGTFYETSNWAEYGYACCVEFIPMEGRTLVTSATICKPKQSDLVAALEFSDTPEEFRDTAVAQIEACLGYCGTVVDEDFSGRYEKWFEEDQESDAWKCALQWIKALAS